MDSLECQLSANMHSKIFDFSPKFDPAAGF
jgi:hypothetical protein